MTTDSTAKHTDGVLLTRVFIESEDALRTFLRRFLKCQNDVEDALYETYTRAYSAMERQNLDAPRAFLFRTAKNLALNELKKHSTRYESTFAELNIEEIAEAQLPIVDQLIVDQRHQLLDQAIEQLPRQCRMAFILRKKHHFSHKLIAERLNISTRTVERHMANAVLKCSEYIKQSSHPPTADRDKRSGEPKPQLQKIQQQPGTP